VCAWFVAEAEKFCAFIESATSEIPVVERLVIARQRLLALYAAALTLPVEPESGLAREMRKRAVSRWPGFEPSEDNLVGSSITDDLLDVYGDVSHGLDRWIAGDQLEAVWEWCFYLDTHWGVHAIDRPPRCARRRGRRLRCPARAPLGDQSRARLPV